MQQSKNDWEDDYLDLVGRILRSGSPREDRTGTGTIALFGERLDIDLTGSFPAPTTKRLAWKAMTSELLWFLEGSKDERRLAEILHGTRDPSKRTIWSDNAEAPYWKPKAQFEGDLGPVYGYQWRHWKTGRNIPTPDKDEHIWYLEEEIDQLAQLIDKLKNNPFDRRMIISAWNVADLGQVALPPCHMMAQFFVRVDQETHEHMLSCQMYQRSVDTMLGLPFNIASYALLTHMLAHVTGMTAERLVMSLGDTHIYANHVEGAKEQLRRIPKEPKPTLWLNPAVTDIDSFKMDDIVLSNYEPMDSIKMEMSV